MWLNLNGCQAVQQKLKNSLKTPKMHFLPVFELMSDSLTTIKVEPHQCPSHQSFLLTQGPIHEIFSKISRIGDFEKHCFFESAILNLFFEFIYLFFAFFPWKQVKVYWLARMGQIFDQATYDNTFWPRPNILTGSVFTPSFSRIDSTRRVRITQRKMNGK